MQKFTMPSFSDTNKYDVNYGNNATYINYPQQSESVIDSVAKWFLNKESMSNKRLQKLCYYAYSWFIVFNNDLEDVHSEKDKINLLCPEYFQAWIHGPVMPKLYYEYKKYGWYNIPQYTAKIHLSKEIIQFLNEVWDVYGKFTADELENMSHNEMPWIKARNNIPSGDVCSNNISPYDILVYYSSLE